MKVIREKSILEKIDDEINKVGLPDIVRIDLDEGEFDKFLQCLQGDGLFVDNNYNLIGLKPEYSQLVTKSDVRLNLGSFTLRGSYVVYKDVCVQCCYEEVDNYESE